MLVSPKKVLWDAKKRGYAVGAFNTSNLEITQAIIGAAEELRSPVIVQTSPTAIEYAGIENISLIVRTLAMRAKVPVALHLDHGLEVELARRCIQNGYTSIMIDSSSKPFEENVRMVKEVVKAAWWPGVQVEAEIGRLRGIEDKVHVSSAEELYTDPKEAKRFAELSGCHSLAVAIGTAHGAFKFSKASSLRLDILKEINEACGIPLVLHGASAVLQDEVKKANKYGGKIKGAVGVDEKFIKSAIGFGICKINTDTDLRIAFTAGLREFLAKDPKEFDPRKILGPSSAEIKGVVMHRIQAFGSEGMAENIK